MCDVRHWNSMDCLRLMTSCDGFLEFDAGEDGESGDDAHPELRQGESLRAEEKLESRDIYGRQLEYADKQNHPKQNAVSK